MTPFPLLPAILFIITTLLSLYIFSRALGHDVGFLRLAAIWLFVQGGVALTGFYTVTDVMPPRFLLLVIPPLLVILFMFYFSSGRQKLQNANRAMLTMLHVVRVPVEIVLYGLFLNGVVPEIMTFEGRNLDILAGISAPLIYYFGYVKKKIAWHVLLLWNVIALCLLLNIVVLAVFSAPFPFQKLAFEQPNTGVLYFPFIWLPSLIVPMVLFSHITLIRNIVIERSSMARGDLA